MSEQRAIGLIRVSTDEQAASGAGLAAQRATILAEVAHRGWTLVEIVEEAGVSGAKVDRAGLSSALDRLDRHEAEVLVVAKLDRLSRSVAQGAVVMDRAKRRGWSLVALDFGLDTTTPAGEMVANVILSTAQYERRLIGERTKLALAAKKAQGVVLGRPVAIDPAIADRIVAMRKDGKSLQKIADALNDDDVKTVHGDPDDPKSWRKGKVTTWHASTVRAVLRRLEAAPR